MDVARRWQIATALTAVGGLGVGALALGDQPSEAVPSIELEVADAPAPALAPDRDDADPQEASSEIVAPDVRSLDDSPPSLGSPDSVASADSLDSDD